MPNKNTKLLDILVGMLDEIDPGDEDALDRFSRRGNMFLCKIYGAESRQVKEFDGIYFNPLFMDPTPGDMIEAWETAKRQMMNLLQTLKEEQELEESEPSSTPTTSAQKPRSETIFVVHGRDEEMKQSVARMVEKLGLRPIILHEEPNRGRTIIEKFSDHSEVGFAIALLSPDDMGRAHDEESTSFRARQNVIFELGFFLGKLGRERVVSIYRRHAHFDMPSDYSGVLFIPYDSDGAWRFALAKELRECGYDIDFNAIA